jgi:hypothetical protein
MTAGLLYKRAKLRIEGQRSETVSEIKIEGFVFLVACTIQLNIVGLNDVCVFVQGCQSPGVGFPLR